VNGYLDAEARIVWPDLDAERVQLARRLFGEAIVGVADYWIDWIYNLITNSGPPRLYPHENDAFKEDRAYSNLPETGRCVQETLPAHARCDSLPIHYP
jgi:hypothetical protein